MMRLTHNRVATSRLLALGTLLAALMAAFVMLAASQAHATTSFYVNSTEDHADAILGIDGCNTGYTVTGAGGQQVPECTLRAALNEANYTEANPGADIINFAIPGSGVKTIAPKPALPEITEAVTINGYSQPGASANTKAVGGDAVLKIELNGANASGDGLVIGASNSTVRGLVINRWSLAGIYFRGSGATGNRVVGNYMGTDDSGTQDLGNAYGVYLYEAPNNIGGTTSAERNVISGNNGNGVYVEGADAKGNRIMGNYVGTDKNGTVPLGNFSPGILEAIS